MSPGKAVCGIEYKLSDAASVKQIGFLFILLTP
jgi:hypothetical protein